MRQPTLAVIGGFYFSNQETDNRLLVYPQDAEKLFHGELELSQVRQRHIETIPAYVVVMVILKSSTISWSTIQSDRRFYVNASPSLRNFVEIFEGKTMLVSHSTFGSNFDPVAPLKP